MSQISRNFSQIEQNMKSEILKNGLSLADLSGRDVLIRADSTLSCVCLNTRQFIITSPCKKFSAFARKA
jgi:hypothetical protein